MVIWEDGHQSFFSENFLKKHSFSPEGLSQREHNSWKNQLWGCELQQNIPRADYQEVMNSKESELTWLHELIKFGFVLLENVPVEEGHVPALQKRIAFEKLTHWGPGYSVVVRPDPAQLSHTHHRIGFHTDLTYYHHMPGTVFLHCLQQHQGPGGETMLVDAFHCAKVLKEKDPESHKLLSETIGQFVDIGEDYIKFHKENRQPFLVHDITGTLKRVNWSNFCRDSYLDIPLEKVEPLYKAMKTFEDILNDPTNYIHHKMKPGEMVCLVNNRVMHGRSELYGKVSARHLQCGYMDWDEVASRTRVLERELGQREL